MGYILGIQYTGVHDSSLSIVSEDGSDIFVAEEERYSRKKNDGSFPEKSIEVIKSLKKEPSIAAISLYPQEKVQKELRSYDLKAQIRNRLSYLAKSRKVTTAADFVHMLGYLSQSILLRKNLRYLKTVAEQGYVGSESDVERRMKYVSEIAQEKEKYFTGHQNAHAASAYYLSGFDKALVFVKDAGNPSGLYCTTLSEGNGSGLERTYSSPDGSIPSNYAAITTLLGYKPNRHEGKITGLAAFGKHNKKCISAVERITIENPPLLLAVYLRKAIDICQKGKKPAFVPLPERIKEFSWVLGKFKREDIAYAIQHITEKKVLYELERLKENTSIRNIALAGGLFANVKLNQKIKEAGFKKIFIHPAMGDSGLALGSALYYLGKEKGLKPREVDNVYFGSGFSDDDIKAALKRHKIEYEKIDKIEMQIAELLSKGKVVARFNGRMEYGPRALGNRSILYQATDPSVNDWLNKRLNRTEFMPFAPVTLEQDTHKCYLSYHGSEYAAKFMTITFDCTDWMKDACPAVVHIDGTARPQLIDKKGNPSYYSILSDYKKITGLPSIINTSFNMHEEPIVCTPDEAIRSFSSGHLDYLAIGDFLVKNAG